MFAPSIFLSLFLGSLGITVTAAPISDTSTSIVGSDGQFLLAGHTGSGLESFSLAKRGGSIATASSTRSNVIDMQDGTYNIKTSAFHEINQWGHLTQSSTENTHVAPDIINQILNDAQDKFDTAAEKHAAVVRASGASKESIDSTMELGEVARNFGWLGKSAGTLLDHYDPKLGPLNTKADVLKITKKLRNKAEVSSSQAANMVKLIPKARPQGMDVAVFLTASGQMRLEAASTLASYRNLGEAYSYFEKLL